MCVVKNVSGHTIVRQEEECEEQGVDTERARHLAIENCSAASNAFNCVARIMPR